MYEQSYTHFLCSIFISASEMHVRVIVHAFLMFFFFFFVFFFHLRCMYDFSYMCFLYLFFLVFIENDKVFCRIGTAE